MTFRVSLISLSFVLAFVGTAQESKPTPEPPESPAPILTQPAANDAIHQVKTWIDSFRNKDEAYILNAMKDMKITRSKWSVKGHDQLLLLASSLDSKMSFYFYENRVIKASVQFLSE